MRSRLLSLIYPLTRILLAFRVAMLLLAPAMLAHAGGGEWQQFPDSPVARQPITALIVDRQGDVWAGTAERGLARWDGQAWSSFTTAAGLPDMRIVSLYEDGRGRLWIATGTGIGYLPPDRAEFRRVGKAGIPALPVTALAEGARGGLWLGTPRGMAGWREDGALEVVAEIAERRIHALAAAADGSVWAATDDGLWRGAASEWRAAQGPDNHPFTWLVTGSEGALYAGSSAGVWRLDGETWSRVMLPGQGRLSAAALAGERLWAAGAGSIFAAEGDLAMSYGGSELPSSTVTAVAGAGDGSVWFGTSAGLAQFLPDGAAPTIGLVSINGVGVRGGAARLERNRIERVAVAAEDEDARTRAPQRLLVYAQLEGIDDEPRLITDGELGSYRDVRLSPGEHTLRVWAVDEAFNRSSEKVIRISVPDLTYGPLGVALPTEAVAPLAAVVATALAAVVAAGAVVIGVRKAAEARRAAEAARVRSVLAQAGNPYERGLPDDPGLRSAEEREILAALTAGEGRSVLLLGPRGIGKTTLLRRLAGTLNLDSSVQVVGAYVDAATDGGDEFFARLIAGVYRALEPQMVGERPRLGIHERGDDRAAAEPVYGEREFGADLSRLLSFVGASARGELTVALLLDNAGALDRGPAAPRDAVRRLVLASTGRGGTVRLVLAAETPPVTIEGLSGQLLIAQLPPLPQPALEQLLLRPAKGVYVWETDAARGAISLSMGRPGRLREVAENAVASARRDGRIRILHSDVVPVRPAP